jgi:hypothetical protein
MPISLVSRLEAGIYLGLKNKRGLDGEVLGGDERASSRDLQNKR